MGNMLRVNRSEVIKQFQGIIRWKHVSRKNVSCYRTHEREIHFAYILASLFIDRQGDCDSTRGSISLVSESVESADTLQFFLIINSQTFNCRERRAPFSPTIVKRLVKNGVKVIVQPSNRRAYPMQVCTQATTETSN